MKTVYELIADEEGFSNTLYTDTEGFKTIGYGFCLDKIKMPDCVADYWLRYIVDRLDEEFQRSEVANIFKNLKPARYNIILAMAYQLGIEGTLSFKKMWAALDREDYELAAKEMLDSKWASQTPARCQRAAEIMRNG